MVSKFLWVTTLIENKDAFFAAVYYASRPRFNNFLPTAPEMINSVELENSRPRIIEED
jgi:hypothetical protein